MKRSQLLLQVPLLLILAWWTVCLMVFLSAWPIDYARTNWGLVTASIVASGFFLAIGFRLFAPRFLEKRPLPDRAPSLALMGLIASIALVGPIVNAYSGFTLSQINVALSDQGAAFEQGSQRILEGMESRRSLLAVQTLLAPLTLLALPVIALRWFELRRGGPLLIAALAVPLTTSVMVGRDQQLGWSLVLLFGAWLVSRSRAEKPIRVRTVAVLASLVAVFAVMSGARKVSRTGAQAICPAGSADCLFDGRAPNAFEAALAYFASYSSQGLEGLGRALDTTWGFGGGLAHAPALANVIYPLLGVEPATTVEMQLEEVDWSATWYWSSALTSLANDVPWLLVPVLFLGFGALLGSAWRNSVTRGDALSVAVFTLTWLGALYTPQNLQLAASGPVYAGYIALVLVYLIRAQMRARRKRNDPEASLTYHQSEHEIKEAR